jgi:hypothetical protein
VAANVRSGIGIDFSRVLSVRACPFSLVRGRPGPRFGLGGLAASVGGLFVGFRAVHLGLKSAGLGFLAVLTRDLTTILESPIARSGQDRRENRDQDHGANCDQNDCDRAHCQSFLGGWVS